MTTLNFPSGLKRPKNFSFILVANGLTFSSPLSQTTQTVGIPGAAWMATLEWPNLARADWRLLEAFRSQLRGVSGRAFIGPIHASKPFLPISGAPVVQGAGQTGGTIVTGGWGPNKSVLGVGDYLSFDTALGRELKQVVTSPSVADASGHATLGIEPPIRNSPNNAAVITINNPTCVMGLAGPNEGQGAFTPGQIGAFTFNFIERFQ